MVGSTCSRARVRRAVAACVLGPGVPAPVVVVVAQVPRFARHDQLPAPPAGDLASGDVTHPGTAYLLVPVAIAPGGGVALTRHRPGLERQCCGRAGRASGTVPPTAPGSPGGRRPSSARASGCMPRAGPRGPALVVAASRQQPGHLDRSTTGINIGGGRTDRRGLPPGHQERGPDAERDRRRTTGRLGGPGHPCGGHDRGGPQSGADVHRRGIDPALAQHVAELAETVENHGLLLARLLDNE